MRAGKLRALAVTSDKRSVAAPEYPTLAEAGVPGYHHTSWIGLFAPARTPRAVIVRLHAEASAAVRSQEVKTVLIGDGLEATGTTPGEFAAFVQAEIAKWMKVTKAANITAP